MPKAKVFVSYSHRDRAWKDRLVGHLQVLEREGALDIWDDDRIPAGADWLAEIQGAIQSAQVAVLLVSVDFLNSRFIREKEVPELLARRKAEGLHVFPVIVDDCLWEEVREISSIQSRPLNGRPLTSFSRTGRKNRELVAIAREILRLVGTDPTPSVSKATKTLRPLHQLPAPPADFVGREAELAELRAAIGKGAPTICGLQGMGGVGKTALALRLAHEFRDAYPDGQIYLDLRGVSEKPVTSDEAMAHVIRAFHPEAKAPEGDQLAALYREVLHDKRALLLMDNASGNEQVVPLLPPEGCALLVTSRSRFSLPGLFRIDLEQLPDIDACQLLLTIERRIEGQAESIARLCGCLPFALRVAADTLANQPGLRVDDYLHRLRQEGENAALGEGALGTSYAFLTEDLRLRFRTLSAFSGNFDALAATAVWGLSEKKRAADEALDELVRLSLLHGDEGRYKLHDLARAFAARICTAAENEEVRARHAGHFREVLRTAKKLHGSGSEHILSGLALFDRERSNILIAQEWAAERTETSKIAAVFSRDFPRAGSHFLRRLSPRERIAWLMAGVDAAKRLEEHNLEGIHLGSLGDAFLDTGDIKSAIEKYEQRLALEREFANAPGESKALSELGDAYAAIPNMSRALEYHSQGLALAASVKYQKGKGRALRNLARDHLYLGEIQRAIEGFKEALLIFRGIGAEGKKEEADVFGNLGNAYAALGDTESAIAYCEQHLAIAREIGDRTAETNALGNLGRALTSLGDNHSAINFLEQQLSSAKELGDRRAEGTALGHLGRAHYILGDLENAIDYYLKTLPIIDELADKRSEALLSWNLGLAYEKLGRIQQAVDRMQVCVDFECAATTGHAYPGRGHLGAEERDEHLAALRSQLPLLTSHSEP